MEIISDEKEIALLQKRFEDSLKSRGDKQYKIKVGYLGGSVDIEAYYSSKLDIWFAFKKVSNRYWNPFGLGKPRLQGSNSIVVEINFPVTGIDKRIAGCFVRDNERILVCHRGRIGGGKPGIGFKAFWDQYTGERIKIKNEELALVGDLNSEDFPERVKDFVIEVNRIKNFMIESGDFFQQVDEDLEEGEFALSVERDIQNYIVSNPDSLEKGLKVYGKEYETSVGRIDVLCIDKNSNYVVIEIKARRADISTFGQISSYMGSIQRDLAKGKKVRGIIIASDFDEKLKAAILTNPQISLKKYSVTFRFSDVE